MGKIADTIYKELSYMYCDNCRHSSEDTDEDYSHCDGCYRKYSNWAVSKETAEYIEKLCKGYINNLEKTSFMKGYNHGCDDGKKFYERPQGKWVIDAQGYYHCNKCNRIKQQSDNNYCANCGADMRGNTNEG